MQQAAPPLTDPFLSPEFAIAVGRSHADAEVAILTEGQTIAGFFPFGRRRFGLGVPVGGWLSQCQAVVHTAGWEWSARELLRGCKLSAWQFDNLVADQLPFEPYRKALMPSPVIDLTDGFDAYYAKLRLRSTHFCKKLRGRIRRLEQDVGELRVVADSRDADLLRMLMAWKSSQYRRTGVVDRFANPKTRELLETLLATREDLTTGLLSVLYAGDRPVAAQFGLRAGPVHAVWFTGYDVELGKYSPGTTHFVRTAEELARMGVRQIHLGRGAASYAQTLKSHDNFVAEGMAVGWSLAAAAHRTRGSLMWHATRTIRQHRGLRDAADGLLRHTGVARRAYGRI
jgi:CelD/BcsL family acetyltransferase involved in cellulose biosynthesis